MSNQSSPATNVFDAAKAIVEILKNLDKQIQVQAIRFANESLGLSTAPQAQASVTPIQPATPGTPPSIAGQIHSTDIKTFTGAKAPKSDQQFATVVAYYYRFEAPETARMDSINAETLQEAARLAGRNRLMKPSMTLTNAKNAGYLDLVGGGIYKINAVGENLVAMTLPGSQSDGSTARNGGRKKSSTKKKPPNKKARAKKAPKPAGK